MNKQKLFIDESAGEIGLIISEQPATSPTLILAHGAGAGMEHSFMNTLAKALSSKGIRVVRFNFPYKEKGRKMPGSPKEAISAYKKVVEYCLDKFPESKLFLSGKSYGGRMASHLIAENPDLTVGGIIYFGFPLHAPGKAGLERAKHLISIKVPQLFLQGSNDALAQIDLIEQVVLDQQLGNIVIFQGADHSFKVKKDTEKSNTQAFADLVGSAADWIQSIH